MRQQLDSIWISVHFQKELIAMEKSNLALWEHLYYNEADIDRERVVREGFLEEVTFELRSEGWIGIVQVKQVGEEHSRSKYILGLINCIISD